MSTDLLSRTQEQTQLGSGPVTHIVPPKDGKEGAERVMEARVLGTPVTALCGQVFTPTRDPKPLPICTGCEAAWESRFGSEPERDGDQGPVTS